MAVLTQQTDTEAIAQETSEDPLGLTEILNKFWKIEKDDHQTPPERRKEIDKIAISIAKDLVFLELVGKTPGKRFDFCRYKIWGDSDAENSDFLNWLAISTTSRRSPETLYPSPHLIFEGSNTRSMVIFDLVDREEQ